MSPATKPKRRDYKAQVKLAPYNTQTLELVISDDPPCVAVPRYKKWNIKAGDLHPDIWCIALTMDFEHALFFQRGYVTHGAIAHEVHHIHTRVFETIEHKHMGNDEPEAYLVQFITDWTYRQFQKAKAKVDLA